MQNRVHRVDAIVVYEWRVAGQHLAKYDTKRKDIATTIHALAQQLLGRHVVDRAHQRARLSFNSADQSFLFTVSNERAFSFGDELRESEVEHLREAITAEHQVLGFEIAMNDAELVSARETRCDLNRDIERLSQLQPVLCDLLANGVAFDVLHRDVRPAVVLADFVDGE